MDKKYKYLYCHLRGIDTDKNKNKPDYSYVNIGDWVYPGMLIAKMGFTGKVWPTDNRGTHLHFAMLFNPNWNNDKKKNKFAGNYKNPYSLVLRNLGYQ